MSPIRAPKSHKLMLTPRVLLNLKMPKAIRRPRGRKSKLNDSHIEWILRTEREYESKISPYNGKSEDDEDLKDWVDTKWSLFADEFANDFVNSPLSIDEWEKSFKGRYRNHRLYMLKKANDACSAISADDQSEFRKGYSTFTSSYGAKDNRKETISMSRSEMSNAEKDEWHRIAKTHEVDEVYENQTRFSSLLHEAITRSQGFEAHQSGDSAHLVISTFRDRDGVLQNHMFVIEGKKPGAKKLSKMFPELKKSKMISKWDKYTAQAIPDTLAEKYALEKNPPPLLKEAGSVEEEDNLTPAAIRVMLEEHFINLWAYAQGDSNRVIPWDDIAKKPQAFISNASLPPTIAFKNPHQMDRDHLHHLRTLILNHQKDSPFEPYIHFVDMSDSKVKVLGGRVTVPDNSCANRSAQIDNASIGIQQDDGIVDNLVSDPQGPGLVGERNGADSRINADNESDSRSSRSDNCNAVKAERVDSSMPLQAPNGILSTLDSTRDDEESSLQATQNTNPNLSMSEGARPKKRSKGTAFEAQSRGSSGESVQLDTGTKASSSKRTRRMTEKAQRSGLWSHNDIRNGN